VSVGFKVQYYSPHWANLRFAIACPAKYLNIIKITRLVLPNALAERSRSPSQPNGLLEHCAGLQSPSTTLRASPDSTAFRERTVLFWSFFYKQMALR